MVNTALQAAVDRLETAFWLVLLRVLQKSILAPSFLQLLPSSSWCILQGNMEEQPRGRTKNGFLPKGESQLSCICSSYPTGIFNKYLVNIGIFNVWS